MKKAKRILALLMALVMALGMLTACGDKGGSDDDGIKDEMVIGTDENVTTLDPAGSNSRPNHVLYWMTHEALLINNLDGTFSGQAAESYEQVSPTQWKFVLRKGVKFHNGEELKASDVKFTLERAAESSFTSDKVSWITSIETPDEYTVIINLSEPVQDILCFLSDRTLSIVNEKAVTEDPEEGPGVGCGPYKLREWVLNDHTTLDLFEDYYGEKPKSKVITLRIIPEAAARLIALSTHEIDICLFPARIDLDTIRNNEELQLFEMEGSTMHYVTFNTTRAPFNDANVRKAVAYAIDRAKVIEIAEEGLATPAYTFFSAGFGQYSGVEHYDTNLEQAKQLLAAAGYSESNKLTFTMQVSGDVKLLQAQAIQMGLNATGMVDARIESMELTALKDLFKKAEYDMSLYNWANGASGPDTNVRPILSSGSGSNRSHYANAEMDALMDKALVEMDAAKREQMYQDLQTSIINDLPIMPLYYDRVFVGADANVQNFTPDNQECHDFSRTYVVEK